MRYEWCRLRRRLVSGGVGLDPKIKLVCDYIKALDLVRDGHWDASQKETLGRVGRTGISVGKPKALQDFKKKWKVIGVLVDRKTYQFRLTNTFWTTCPINRQVA